MQFYAIRPRLDNTSRGTGCGVVSLNVGQDFRARRFLTCVNAWPQCASPSWSVAACRRNVAFGTPCPPPLSRGIDRLAEPMVRLNPLRTAVAVL